MRYQILLCGLVGFIGVTTTAYGAGKKLPEADACGMAKAEVLNRQGGRDRRAVNVVSCANYSIMDRGMARIQVLYETSYFNEYMKTRYETKNLTDVCSFTRTSQGWKIVRCK